MTGRPSAHLIDLTAHQARVLALIACGCDQPRIAKELGITVNTVRSHTRDIFVRLGADNNAHAVALAIGYDLLPADVAISLNAARR